MIEKFLVEFDGGEDVWDFEQSDFKKGNCFLNKPLKRTQHSFAVQRQPEKSKGTLSESSIPLVPFPKKQRSGTNALMDPPKPKYNDPTKYAAPVEEDI